MQQRGYSEFSMMLHIRRALRVLGVPDVSTNTSRREYSAYRVCRWSPFHPLRMAPLGLPSAFVRPCTAPPNGTLHGNLGSGYSSVLEGTRTEGFHSRPTRKPGRASQRTHHLLLLLLRRRDCGLFENRAYARTGGDGILQHLIARPIIHAQAKHMHPHPHPHPFTHGRTGTQTRERV